MALGAAWADSARRLTAMGLMENFIFRRIVGIGRWLDERLELGDVADEKAVVKNDDGGRPHLYTHQETSQALFSFICRKADCLSPPPSILSGAESSQVSC
jgi:hypothetical protein